MKECALLVWEELGGASWTMAGSVNHFGHVHYRRLHAEHGALSRHVRDPAEVINEWVAANGKRVDSWLGL